MELDEQSNLYALFVQRVRESPDAPAYRQHDGSRWRDYTWAETAQAVARWQTAFAREGLKAGDRVALCLRNRVEWVWFDQAALGLGLVTVPLYFGDRADNMAFCLNDAGVKLLFLDSGALWRDLKGHVPSLTRVVCLTDADTSDPKVAAVNNWLPAQGELAPHSPAQGGELASLVYTSGTTGRPKGVMLSHRNILSNVIASMHAIPVHAHDRFLSFLPLSHMLERTCGYYTALWAGAQTVYARGITVLADDIREQRPTILIAVPRIFERIYTRMQEAMRPGSLKARLFEAAVTIGWRRFSREATGSDAVWWPLLKLLVANKLQRRLGGRIRLIIVGGAPFAAHLARVFMGLGLPILQGYGLTETAPVLAANRAGDNDPNSVGRPLEGIELRCAENGELLARGPGIMLGYWNNPQATEAVIDKDGWLHTGDLVRMRDGRVYITGRVKEIIVLSSGEKVPPADAEQAILSDTAFEQVMVIGEGRAKLGLLVVSPIESLKELCERANRQLHDFPGYARICHIARVPAPWTVENGMITPTLKLKRKEIERRHQGEIEAMYATIEHCGSPTTKA
jgi:long-chain acyl-CoA synthetase